MKYQRVLLQKDKIMKKLLTGLAISALVALPLTAQESSSSASGGSSAGSAGGASGPLVALLAPAPAQPLAQPLVVLQLRL